MWYAGVSSNGKCIAILERMNVGAGNWVNVAIKFAIIKGLLEDSILAPLSCKGLYYGTADLK